MEHTKSSSMRLVVDWIKIMVQQSSYQGHTKNPTSGANQKH